MIKNEKKYGFVDITKDVLGYISQIISASIFPSITQGTSIVMNNIEDRIIRIEKRIMRKISSFLIIGFGGVFLIFSFFFFLIEYLDFSKTMAFFSIGIIIFIIGLMLKLGEPKSRR
jgi:hypothetical protein